MLIIELNLTEKISKCNMDTYIILAHDLDITVNEMVNKDF
jgi:hypothetical protein